MNIRSREEAAAASLLRTTNKPGTCQLVTRDYFNAPSAGDRDHDGDYDAVDGWASEPVENRHPGDRKPPRGTPVRWSGGSKGYGHSALSLGPIGPNGTYMIRTTDAPTGVTSTQPLSYPETHWGHHYLGYSDTIDGYPIPYDRDAAHGNTGTPTRVVPKAGKRVTRAIRLLEKSLIRAEAKGQRARAASLRVALKAARKSQAAR